MDETVTYDFWDLGGTTQYLNGFCIIKNQAKYGACKFGDINTDINNAAFVALVIPFYFRSQVKLNRISPLALSTRPTLADKPYDIFMLLNVLPLRWRILFLSLVSFTTAESLSLSAAGVSGYCWQ